MSGSIRQPPPRSAPTLRFDRTVPRQIAHRRALSEVFISDWAHTGDDEFVVAAQAPRAHCLWHDRPASHHDPLVMLEASRQATFVVAHSHYGVPTAMRFMLQDIEFRVADLAHFQDDHRTPLEGIFHLTLTDKQEHAGVLNGLRFSAELAIGGSTAMTLSGGIVFVARDDYELLRAHMRARKRLDGLTAAAPAPPIEAASIGRRDPRNVVIGEAEPGAGGELRFPLVVDRTHPSFFDHPQDHVPGPVMVEAYRQAGIVAAVRSGAIGPACAVTSCATRFTDFAEFEAPAECSAAVVGTADEGVVAIRAGMHQLGQQLAEAEIELTEVTL